MTAAYRERTRGNVTSALNTLQALGYRSWTGSDRPWASFERRGEVTATVLTEDWRWQTRSGDWMTARAGDYRVSNGQGNAWSVEPAIFTRRTSTSRATGGGGPAGCGRSRPWRVSW